MSGRKAKQQFASCYDNRIRFASKLTPAFSIFLSLSLRPLQNLKNVLDLSPQTRPNYVNRRHQNKVHKSTLHIDRTRLFIFHFVALIRATADDYSHVPFHFSMPLLPFCPPPRPPTLFFFLTATLRRLRSHLSSFLHLNMFSWSVGGVGLWVGVNSLGSLLILTLTHMRNDIVLIPSCCLLYYFPFPLFPFPPSRSFLLCTYVEGERKGREDREKKTLTRILFFFSIPIFICQTQDTVQPMLRFIFVSVWEGEGCVVPEITTVPVPFVTSVCTGNII